MRGLALGFDITSEHLKLVIYENKLIPIPINPVTNLPILDDNWVDQLSRTKFDHWWYEDEMRVFVKLDDKVKESGLYYYPFDDSVVLREIVLGPRCTLPMKSIEALVASFVPTVRIVQSRLAFSAFEVEEDASPTSA